MRTPCRFAVLLSLVLAPFAPATETAVKRWKQTGQLAAAEATQAAAADEDFVYAVTNHVVAKYERATGKLLAHSTGKAQHLNSAFVHEGKVYCAHSNYPRKPEQSQIMVLDPQTMQLTVFKDFGNYGGSLTWVVRHDDGWWCNFARYGEKNAETFLVRFDDEWREDRRWTYPPEVVKRLGTYSVSGGLWRDERLLVTDHDHGILYELRVPEEDSVLELAALHKAPFTGQGIAADPKTGGLVGINRAKKLVVFAESQ